MRICYLGWGHSIHTQRWIGWFARKNHSVFLITNHLWGQGVVKEHLIKDSLSHIPFGKSIDFINNIGVIRKIIKNLSPDILHLHTLYYPAFLGVYSGFKPLVVTPWNGDVIVKSRNRSFIQNISCKLGLKRADLITVDSEDLRQGCFKYVNHDKWVEIIQWGVDMNEFNPSKRSDDLKNRLGLSKDTKIVLSTRHLSKEYNVEVIIRSIPYVVKAIRKVAFIFLYLSGRDLESLKNIARDLGIFEHCFFLGSVPAYNDLAQYYASSDAYVSVSSWDTTSVSLLEAMACGTVPIIGDLPSLREWIKNEDNGFIVKLNAPKETSEAIVNVLNFDECRSNYIREKNINIIKEKANHETNMQRMEDLYYNLLENYKYSYSSR